MSVLTLQPGKGNKVHLLLDGQYAMTVDSDFVLLAGKYPFGVYGYFLGFCVFF